MCVCVCVRTWYLLDDHLAEVTDYVRQQIAPWVCDLIHQLLCGSTKGDETTCFWWFGEKEGAIAGTLNHGESNIVPDTQAHYKQIFGLSSIFIFK